MPLNQDKQWFQAPLQVNPKSFFFFFIQAIGDPLLLKLQKRKPNLVFFYITQWHRFKGVRQGVKKIGFLSFVKCNVG
jgi:hypothetical protein